MGYAVVEDRQARMALNSIIEPGDARAGELVARFGATEVWASLERSTADGAWASRARALDLRPLDLLARRHGLRFVVPGDAEWPHQLADLATCEPVREMGGVPLGLWVKGESSLSDLMARSVAIVGSRASSSYGDRVAADLAGGLTAGRMVVVSGGAFGIDAAAHRGALAEGGPTVAVLAGGLDQPYPRAHDGLLAQAAENGLLVSELPPGQHPTRQRFLARNRLIAALTGGTVLVEAAVRSGARNTVTWANACGRVVMAVPGPVGNATSFTPHRLIRDGEAVLVATHEHVLELLEPAGTALVEKPTRPRLLDALDPTQFAVYEALPTRGGRDAGELALASGTPVQACLAALGELADLGLAQRRSDGRWGLGDVRDRPVRVPSGRGDQCSNSARSSSV